MGLEHIERCYEVIQILKLQKYYPKKINRQQALTVSESLILREHLKDKGKIPWYILQNLIIGNYDVQSFEASTGTSSLAGCQQQLPSFGSENKDEINPVDALIATLLCCDDFLRQLLVEKISMCQLGIPFLLPDINSNTPTYEMLLWATSTLTKGWKVFAGSSCEQMRIMSTNQLPIVSAIRLGRPKTSKSEMLNEIINDNKHNTFFYYGCEGNEAPKILSIGMLDMTWYLPKATQRDFFPEAFTVMNLHGNACGLKKQVSFLTAISAITIVFCNSDTQNEDEIELIKSWCDKRSQLILVSDGQLGKEWESSVNSVKQAFSKTKGRQHILQLKSDKQCFRKIRRHIVDLMNDPMKQYLPRFSLEDCKCVANEMKIAIDYNYVPENIKANEEATQLVCSLENSEDKSRIKQLPLQTLSTKIADKKLKQHKKQKKGVQLQHYVDEMTAEIKNLRIQQKQFHNRGTDNEVISSFLKVTKFTHCERKYFYSWVRLMLDRYSIKHLQPIRAKFRIAHGYIKNIENEIFQMSLGMENLTREMAQIYEMASDLKSPVDQEVDLYPELAAEMLLEGHPLELMDGDATYVPLTWLKEVLGNLKRKINDKRVFILSVLGLQGTGKSTMLNTMFGLQFPVSAGRCTKGAFAQLVSLDESLAFSTKCNYVLVIDTEGLRALEIETTLRQQRDNAIATFVVGLADATIVNIMGDAVADMQDILQIVVHAFIKMNRVNLKPSCFFVHQNVTDVNASEITCSHRKKLVEILDETTKISSAKYFAEWSPSFSDIIHFQADEHVNYITTLWEGTPPMAPQNPDYCQSIVEVRKKVLALMRKVKGPTIDEFKYRLTDLWNAVTSEDFVFSFTNTFEMKAHDDLETFYLQKSRTFNLDVTKICNDLVDTCRNQSPDDIERSGNEILKKHTERITEHFKQFCVEMDNYYTECPMAKRWKDQTENKMSRLINESEEIVSNEFSIVKLTVIERENIEEMLRTYEHEIQKKSREHAAEIRESFNDMWNRLTADVPFATDPIDIETELKEILRSKFERHQDSVMQQLKSPTDIPNIEVYTDDIVPKTKGFQLFQKLVNPDDKLAAETKDVRTYCQEISKSILTHIEKYERRSCNCNKFVLKELVEKVCAELRDVPGRYTFVLSPIGIAKLTISIMWSQLPNLKHLQATFMKKNDLRMYVSSQKERYWQWFNNECTMGGIIMGATSVVLLTLNRAIDDAVKRHLPTTVINYLKNSPHHKITLADKRSFHATVLIELGEMKSFKEFSSYLLNPANYMTRHLQNYIKRYLETESHIEGKTVLQTCYEECMDEHFSEAKLAIKNACKITNTTCKLDEWWESLIKNFKLISIQRKSPHLIDKDKNINIEEFLEKLLKEVNLAEMNVQNTYRNTREEILITVLDPTVNFFKSGLIGCEAVCPFCHSPCDHLSDCLDHRTACHRPQGIGGRQWDESSTLQKITGNDRKDELVIDLCTTLIDSERMFKCGDEWQPYKKYKEKYPNWEINPDTSSEQLYWKWFMAKFNKELAELYECKEGSIPDSWNAITWQSAKKDLTTLYNLERE